MLKKLILENPKLNMNNIRIISSSLVSAPMVYGFFRGVIIIPKQDFSDEELSFILQHEVYHFTHHHVWVKLVTELIYIIYWWNPILLFTRIRANELLEKEVDLNIIQNHNNKTTVEYTKFLLSMFEKQKLVSTVEQNSYGKTSLISEFININYTTVFYSRCKTILAYDKKQQRSTIIFLKYMIMGICIMIGSMVVIHPEYVPDEEGVFELTEEDSYLKPTSSGYDIYYNDEYLYSIDENLEGYEYLPIEE
jgi:beta-lactamase regulating signal transducer with metallopeptidase domain